MPGTLEVYVETYAKVARRNPSVVQTFRGVAQEGMHIPQYVRSWCVRKRQIFGLRPIFPKYVVQFRNSFADSKFCPIHSATYGSRVFRIFRRLLTALGGFRWHALRLAGRLIYMARRTACGRPQGGSRVTTSDPRTKRCTKIAKIWGT